MASKGNIEREEKIKLVVKRYEQKRSELKKKIIDSKIAPNERFQIQMQLDDMKKDSSKIRMRNRCMFLPEDQRIKILKPCGRSNGVNRQTGLCRFHAISLARTGCLPGFRKASW